MAAANFGWLPSLNYFQAGCSINERPAFFSAAARQLVGLGNTKAAKLLIFARKSCL
jgi:hypothetical protein